MRSVTGAIVLHAAAVILHLTCLQWFFNHELVPWKHTVNDRVLGNWRYLTYWNLVAQFVTFAICLLTDFIRNERLCRLRDQLFYSIATPVGLFVFGAFWLICFIDPNLVYPVKLLHKIYFPLWVNLSVHTSMVPFILIELWLVNHPLPSKFISLSICSLFIAGYFTVLLYSGLVIDFWVYPILDVLHYRNRVFFMVTCVCINYALYFFGRELHNLFWAQPKVCKTN